MEHYEKGERIEIDDVDDPFAGLKGIDLTDVVIMRVKHGSKIRNLMGYAMRTIKAENTKHIIFCGSGPAVSKTISCVEIMKRKIKTLHQVSKIYFKRIEEHWEPKDKDEGLDRLKVNRHIPAISVLLSKDQLDVNEPGYQAPGCYDALWVDKACQEKAIQQLANKCKYADAQRKQTNKSDRPSSAKKTTHRTKKATDTPQKQQGKTKDNSHKGQTRGNAQKGKKQDSGHKKQDKTQDNRHRRGQKSDEVAMENPLRQTGQDAVLMDASQIYESR